VGRDRRSPSVRNDHTVTPNGELTVTAPFAGVVVAIPHAPNDRISAGAPVMVLEAMKMEHEVLAESGGVVQRVEVVVGEAVQEGQVLAVLAPGSDDGARDLVREPLGRDEGE